MRKILKFVGISAAVFAVTEFIGACGEAQAIAALTDIDCDALGKLSKINKFAAEYPEEMRGVSKYAKMKCRFIENTARLLLTRKGL